MIRAVLLQYELRLTASDNLKENYTTVVIHVKDVNDNPPVFERPNYRTQITEEDDRTLPKRVLGVIAPLICDRYIQLPRVMRFVLRLTREWKRSLRGA